MMNAHVLIVDNNDSFTMNIAHLVHAAIGAMPRVELASATQKPILNGVSHLIIGPGPGTPHNPEDLGHSRALYREALAEGIPVLGVCLGAQLMAVEAGGVVSRAPVPMHGLEDVVTLAAEAGADPVLSALPDELTVVRYHSLAITRIPRDLEVLGTSPDGVPQIVRHRRHAAWGVQFHPESIRSAGGVELMRAFLAYGEGGHAFAAPERALEAVEPVSPRPKAGAPTHTLAWGEPLLLADLFTQAELLFSQLVSPLERPVWLDSASTDARSRFSIMGAADGPGAHVIHYRVGDAVPEGPFSRLFASLAGITLDETGLQRAAALGGFALGYVGYLGYGLAAETLGVTLAPAHEPDAHLVFLTRALVLDHDTKTVRPIALAALDGDERSVQEAWIAETNMRVRKTLADTHARTIPTATPAPEASFTPAPVYRHASERYLEMIRECHEIIARGESYELCLTNEARVPGRFDPLAVYRNLRGTARVPYGAYLDCGSFTVASASPERFLEVGMNRLVHSRPIKGTASRGATPEQDAEARDALAASVKDRAENLMIVDLVRHDLSHVCEPGSVRVPSLFAIESFPTVHQMISTIEGTLAPSATALDAIAAAFPGGSMTGAPKLRTVQLLDGLEQGPRGVYSGALGWISVSGAASLNIVIRTLILDDAGATFSVGGAITRLSEPEAELEETRVKARTVLAALAASTVH